MKHFRRYGYGPGGYTPGGGYAPGSYTTGEPEVQGGVVLGTKQIAPVNPMIMPMANPVVAVVKNSSGSGVPYKTPGMKVMDPSSGTVKGVSVTGDTGATINVPTSETKVGVVTGGGSIMAPGAEVGLINRGDPYDVPRRTDQVDESTESMDKPWLTSDAMQLQASWWSRFKPYLPLAGVAAVGLGVLIVAISTRE